MAEHATLRSSVIHLLHRAGQRADDLFTRAGPTVKTLTHAKKKPSELVIDEPMADTIRAKGNLEVTDAVQMTVHLHAVDTTNHTVKLSALNSRSQSKPKSLTLF